MTPEVFLKLHPEDSVRETGALWQAEYRKCAEEFPEVKEIAARLGALAAKAGDLAEERRIPPLPTDSRDDAYYTENEKIRDDEDASLDGDFPLGNERDAAFANSFFSVAELAKIRCGLSRLIDAGDFNGYNFDVLVRRGILAELDGDFAFAARCYGGVSTSAAVQEREYECLRRAETSTACEGKTASSASDADGECAAPSPDSSAAADATTYRSCASCSAAGHEDKYRADGTAEHGADTASPSADGAPSAEAYDFQNETAETCTPRDETAEARDLREENTNLPFHITAALLRSRENPIKKPKRKTVRAHRAQMEEYRLRAEAGDTASMGALAMAYHLGYPVKRDDAQAFLWVSRAADEGDAEAMYQAAYFFENGFGTPRDTDAALLLYTESAEAGVRAAAIRLYEIYTSGITGVAPDGKKAAHFLFMSGAADGENE